MQITTTSLPGVLILEPKVFGDDRGFFFESFNQRAFDAASGTPVNFVQDNHSCSSRGVLRGLHYQTAPHAHQLALRIARGSAFDVAVDIRRGSATFGQWFGITLDAQSQRQLWIPPGFAHGFLALEDDTHFLYKTTDYYAKDCERAIVWNDPAIGIVWPDLGMAPLLAPKDAAAAGLTRADPY
jgi:dTDP-4-dehydrorhamnose 3,5-epimerase